MKGHRIVELIDVLLVSRCEGGQCEVIPFVGVLSHRTRSFPPKCFGLMTTNHELVEHLVLPGTGPSQSVFCITNFVCGDIVGNEKAEYSDAGTTQIFIVSWFKRSTATRQIPVIPHCTQCPRRLGMCQYQPTTMLPIKKVSQPSLVLGTLHHHKKPNTLNYQRQHQYK